ncbi:MAG: hypothetical protein LBD20_06730 [Spirochaetaceae bacterium]|jgi:hypothetical protein|nr:hypothetical protein [Spirochaetaceae bacterium]
MTTAVLKKELKSYIEAMSEHNLYVLKPLLSTLAAPPYTVEADLTSEEIAMIDEGMAEYRVSPTSFVPLESIGVKH